MAPTAVVAFCVYHMCDQEGEGVGDSQLGLPTPCTEWDVRAQIDHVTAVGLMFATCIQDGSCPDGYLVTLITEGQVGPDAVASFRAASVAILGVDAGLRGDMRKDASVRTRSRRGESSVAHVICGVHLWGRSQMRSKLERDSAPRSRKWSPESWILLWSVTRSDTQNEPPI